LKRKSVFTNKAPYDNVRKFLPCSMLFKISVLVLILSSALSLNAQRRTQSLSELKHTEFVTTLDHQIHADKNAIYCATLLLAWNDLRNSLGSIEVDSTDRELYLLDRSRDFENALPKKEYTSSFKVAFNSIHVKATFKKTLPFIVPLTSYATGFVFDGKEVASFGGKGAVEASATVRYYKDDHNAVVGLLPENPAHEILLLITEAKVHTMREAIRVLEEYINAGDNEMQSGKNRWKFDFAGDDKLLIPKIRFDIKTEYPTMEEKVIHSRGMRLEVMELTQQTAFSLDEKGVEIESVGAGEVVFSEPVQDEDRKPKKIIFDKPFFIFIKRKESVNPYLVLWIVNAELMR